MEIIKAFAAASRDQCLVTCAWTHGTRGDSKGALSAGLEGSLTYQASGCVSGRFETVDVEIAGLGSQVLLQR